MLSSIATFNNKFSPAVKYLVMCVTYILTGGKWPPIYTNNIHTVRHEYLTAVVTKIHVVCSMTQHHKKIWTLKIQKAIQSETSVTIHQSTRCHILEGVHIQSLFCANTSKYTTFYNTPRGSANFTHMRNKNNLTLNERHQNSRQC